MASDADARAAFNLSALEGRPPFFFSVGTVGVNGAVTDGFADAAAAENA